MKYTIETSSDITAANKMIGAAEVTHINQDTSSHFIPSFLFARATTEGPHHVPRELALRLSVDSIEEVF